MIRPQVALSMLAASVLGCTDPGPAMPGPDPGATAVSGVPLSDTVRSSALAAPVDVVRDEWGIPHIYGRSFADVAFAQGYTMAQDRLAGMDLGRRLAEGTLGELVGDQQPSVLDQDISMRLHHLRRTGEEIWAGLQASTDPSDQALVAIVSRFVQGVNAYIDDLKAGRYTLPAQLVFVYTPAAATRWDEADVMALALLQAFELAFDADSEIRRTQLDVAGAMYFDNAADPARKARAGIAVDLQILAPVDATSTIDGWTGMNGDMTTAALPGRPGAGLLALLEADRKSVVNIGNDHVLHPSRGSNNWIIAPSLSTSGHALVANDTHLDLINPPTFYLNHLRVAGDDSASVMGVQFAGIPGVILGMNEHIAWGATVSNIDVTDVYQESIVACDGGSDPCVVYKGGKVPLRPRAETFRQGSFGRVSKTYTVTFYDVPHHGPIVPRITADHGIEPLGTTEMSIRYTGYEPAPLFRAILGVDRARSAREAVAALDRDFKYGGQNWVIGDTDGHIAWTEVVRVPRRQPGFAPWKVLPGDGRADWGPDMDPRFIPHAYDPAQGFIATANNDPIGVTFDDDPFFSEPTAPTGDGGSGPLYLGADYDAGTRVGRITKRIRQATAGGGKLRLEDLQSIQADAVTEWGQLFQPTLLDAAQALGDELAHPGSHAELTAILAAAGAADRANLPLVAPIVRDWSFDTPAAVAEEHPDAGAIRDSQATLLAAAWLGRFAALALNDELKVLGVGVGSTAKRKLLAKMANDPRHLRTGVSAMTGDALLFDDLTTPAVVESKRQIAAAALVAALADLRGRLGADLSAWRWGQVHTLTLESPVGIAALNIPPPDDDKYASGFPRHGDDGTVDVASHGLSTTSYTYADGPAIRFVCELDPAGPRARNVLPGGQVFDPSSPHYRDQMELWRANQAFDLAFRDDEVVKSAGKEYAANKLGRVRFEPAGP